MKMLFFWYLLLLWYSLALAYLLFAETQIDFIIGLSGSFFAFDIVASIYRDNFRRW